MYTVVDCKTGVVIGVAATPEEAIEMQREYAEANR